MYELVGFGLCNAPPVSSVHCEGIYFTRLSISANNPAVMDRYAVKARSESK